MDQFVLSIGPEGVPWSLRFNEAPLVGLGDKGDYSEEKIRPLVLLALHTASSRKRGKGNDRLCPSLKCLDIQAAKSLSEAICNDTLYKVSEGKAKENGSQFNSSYWLAAIFGERPLGRYLTGNRHAGDAAFTENVAIVIEDDRDGETKEESEEISSFLSDYLNGVKQSRKTVYLALNLESNGERPATIIDTNSCKGSFRNNADYWIHIETTFYTNFHVFWISPDSADILSPSAPYKRVCKTSDFGVIPKFLSIGEDHKITITPPTGNHICILLLGEKQLPVSNCSDVLSIICKHIPSTLRSNPLKRPELTKHRVEKLPRQKRGIVVNTRARVESWQDKLARDLSGYGRILYVFSIPHI